jgi:hypothetical protein
LLGDHLARKRERARCAWEADVGGRLIDDFLELLRRQAVAQAGFEVDLEFGLVPQGDQHRDRDHAAVSQAQSRPRPQLFVGVLHGQARHLAAEIARHALACHAGRDLGRKHLMHDFRGPFLSLEPC